MISQDRPIPCGMDSMDVLMLLVLRLCGDYGLIGKLGWEERGRVALYLLIVRVSLVR